MHLFCEKYILSKEHMFEVNLQQQKMFKVFQGSALLLHPLKTSKKLWLSDVLLGIEMAQWMKESRCFYKTEKKISMARDYMHFQYLLQMLIMI